MRELAEIEASPREELFFVTVFGTFRTIDFCGLVSDTSLSCPSRVSKFCSLSSAGSVFLFS